MNKQDKIIAILKYIYDNSSELIISENDVDYINNYYKKHFNKCDCFDELCDDERFSKLIKKLHSAKYEVEKQFNLKKALQPGIIAECNFSETLAKILKLNKVIDLDNAKYNDAPKEFAAFVAGTSQTFSGARYLFYNSNNKNIFMFQYGNPALGDAEIIIDGNKIRLEYKERSAKLGEYDILYDDNGKLIPSSKIKSELNAMLFLIDSFNEKTDVFSEIGHNFNDFNINTCIVAANMYIKSKAIDLIISSCDNQLIAVTDDCFNKKLNNNNYAISLKGSEIRTAGRNSKHVWTTTHFFATLNDLNAKKINDEEYSISKNSISFSKARGKSDISRLKISNIYFVRYENIKENGDDYIINISNVMQLVPTISMHMYISASKDELKELLNI